MSRTTTFTAVTLAIALGGASAGLAAGKKPIDPREVYAAHAKKAENGRQTWCDINPQCNGSQQALELAYQKKLKYLQVGPSPTQ
jgi:hypothetical protein